MISSFFDQTKPINLLALLGFVMLLFWMVTLMSFGFQWDYHSLFVRILASLALGSSVFYLGNMVKTKKLTSDNSFAMLFFSMLLLTFFSGLLNTKIIFALFFVLVSSDRTLALKSEKKHKEKIFEAALWLFVASFFVEWALMFLIPLYMAISLFCGKQLRLWLMPVAALICIGILVIAYMLLSGDLGFFKEYYQFPISFSFFQEVNYGMGLYTIFVFVLVFVVFGKLGYRRLGRTLSLRLIFAYLVIAISLLLFSEKGQGMEVLSFFPAAIFLANYLETFKKKKLKELFVLASILLPMGYFLLRLFQ